MISRIIFFSLIELFSGQVLYKVRLNDNIMITVWRGEGQETHNWYTSQKSLSVNRLNWYGNNIEKSARKEQNRASIQKNPKIQRNSKKFKEIQENPKKFQKIQESKNIKKSKKAKKSKISKKSKIMYAFFQVIYSSAFIFFYFIHLIYFIASSYSFW